MAEKIIHPDGIRENSLKDKKAVITGGSRGIGAAIACKLASLGVEVAILGRDETKLQEVTESIEKRGGKVRPFKVDLADRKQIIDFFDKSVSALGTIDIFISNAGVTILKRVLETSEEEMDRLLDINFKATVFCLQRASQVMIEKGNGGSIVIVSSINALAPLPSQAIYSCIKAALEALIRCVAVDLAPHNIRVNSLAPGAIRTDMIRHLTPERIAHLNDFIPLGHIGESDEIADVAVFLAGDGARYITGSTIVADGGYLLRK